MPKTKISEYSATANSNTDVASINIDEGCAPSGINNAIRAIMGHLKDFQSGTSNDPFTVGSSGSLTLSYGTANGVAYLNGSKVLTTGSALVFDGSNLGVGVTPSAWNTGVKAIEGTSDFKVMGGLTFDSLSNAYLNTSNAWIYRATGLASFVRQTSGEFRFFNAPSGTAGNAITWTQAMTLDASGNLLVGGTSNPASARFIAENVSGNQIGLRYTSVATWYNSVDSSGNYIWKSDSTERMRIDTSGNLLVGTTSNASSRRLLVESSTTSGYPFEFKNTASSGTPYGLVISYSGTAPNGTGSSFLYLADNAALRLEVRSNGGIANYSANNVNLSDRREKTNFAPAKSYLDVICAIPVQTFNYIDQNLEDDAGLTLGVVAQDVQAVAPELVMESNWGTEEEPKMRLSIYQTDLQYALMKCIQEQQAIIQSLTDRITALESA